VPHPGQLAGETRAKVHYAITLHSKALRAGLNSLPIACCSMPPKKCDDSLIRATPIGDTPQAEI
jgi:hypothetical protein